MLEKIGEYLGPADKWSVLEFFDHKFRYEHRNYYCEYRSPFDHTHLDQSTYRWHRDSISIDHTVIVWSDRESTEFRYPSSNVIHRFPPGSIIMFANDQLEHRTPPKFHPERNFVRMYRPDMQKVAAFKCVRTARLLCQRVYL